MEPRASAEPAQQPAGAWPAAVDDSLPPGFAPARMPAFRSAPPGGNAICLDNGVWLQLPRRYDEAAAAPGPGAPRLPRLDDVALDERLLRRRPVTSAAMAELAASGLGGGAGNVRAKRVRKHSATAAAAAAAAIADSPGGGADAFGDWEDEAGGAPARKRGRGRGRDGGDAAPVASRRRDLTWADVDDVFGPALAAPPQPPPPPPGATAAQRAWLALAHRDVPMAARAVAAARRGVAAEMLRLAEATQREVRGRVVRSVRLARSGAARLRRLMRDSASLWRRLEREVADSKRRADRDALDATRREEELLEAKRQQQRLNFLLTQTELYSHFMASKTGATPLMPPPAQPAAQPDGTAVPMEEDAETAAMAADVRARAEAAADAALAATAAFDAAVPGGAPAAAPAPAAEVAQPVMFGGTLKGYQLKGLQWLVNVYEQGLNCILADEMARTSACIAFARELTIAFLLHQGLGKTAQAISFLCHLAESAGQWGPFLVVSPASTLPNWADELARFAPGLRLLPYWGASAERAALRKAFDPRRLGKPDAPFHVLVTSYQLLVSDEKHFRRVKWRYMVLDEAQAIKSASSARWKTLLSFACRNRLLLTGTPVQNTMAELWALLHFIMPTLFDSHEQFATWFSRGVEGAVNDGGALNAHQLSRLHAILKPFMLRRVKTEVEAEMAPKTEVMVSCALSARQRALYAAVKDKISIADLLSGGALSEKKTLHLMNIVIQLRKVCNHPELFERRAPRAALRFAPPPPEHSCASTAAAAAATAAATTGPASAPMGAAAPAERLRAPGLAAAEVCLRIPVLLFRDGMRALPSHASGAARSGGAALADAGAMLSIWHAAVIHAGWRGTPRAALSLDAVSERSGGAAWAFTRLVDASPAEAARLGGASRDTLGRWVEHRLGRRAAGAAAAFWAREGTASAQASRRHRPLARAALLLPERLRSLRSFSGASDAPPLLTPLATRLLRAADSLRLARCFLPAATAPPPALRCADPAVAAQQAALDADPWARWLLHAAGERVPPPAACAGAPAVARRGSEHGPMHPAAALAALRWPQRPLLAPLRAALSAELRIQAYALAHALADSGKLQALDRLLRRLSQEGHKVLIFSQMTKMLNLLEDYCRYRKWRFLRLDGSSSIAERREMVSAFQSPGDTHFVFLLSTRAGGLGINLTAADTVIFYESDWNPTMDAQAMDRAHRLGQTRPVTVYRLVCAGSVEERIVRRAQQKQAVQALVMSGAPLPEGLDAGGASDDVFAPEEVVSLLLDDAEVEAQLANRIAPKSHRAPAWGGGRRALRMDGDGVATVAAEAGGEGDDELAGGAAPAKRKAPAKPRVPRAPKAPKATGLFGTKLPQPPPMPPPMPPPPPVAEPAAAEPPPPLAEPPAKRPKVEPPAAPTPAPQPVVLAPPAPPPPAPAAAEAEAAPPPSLFKIKFKVKFTAPPPEDEEA